MTFGHRQVRSYLPVKFSSSTHSCLVDHIIFLFLLSSFLTLSSEIELGFTDFGRNDNVADIPEVQGKTDHSFHITTTLILIFALLI